MQVSASSNAQSAAPSGASTDQPPSAATLEKMRGFASIIEEKSNDLDQRIEAFLSIRQMITGHQLNHMRLLSEDQKYNQDILKSAYADSEISKIGHELTKRSSRAIEIGDAKGVYLTEANYEFVKSLSVDEQKMYYAVQNGPVFGGDRTYNSFEEFMDLAEANAKLFKYVRQKEEAGLIFETDPAFADVKELGNSLRYKNGAQKAKDIFAFLEARQGPSDRVELSAEAQKLVAPGAGLSNASVALETLSAAARAKDEASTPSDASDESDTPNARAIETIQSLVRERTGPVDETA